ncbi:MAG: DUF2058 family protein [Pseudomonadota bacterium]|nr:DUF2058 family protein [Pseudomonadota bacterium]
MNLRDQFLKAGIVSKKDAEAAARDVRKGQKVQQGNQEAKRVLEQREAAARVAELAAKETERLARRKEAEERARRETVLWQGRQILRAHRVRYRAGPQRFYHRSPDGKEAWKLYLPERLAEDLRRGRGAVAWIDGGTEPEIVLVDAESAARVAEIRPELILFWNRGLSDPDPAEQLYEG